MRELRHRHRHPHRHRHQHTNERKRTCTHTHENVNTYTHPPFSAANCAVSSRSFRCASDLAADSLSARSFASLTCSSASRNLCSSASRAAACPVYHRKRRHINIGIKRVLDVQRIKRNQIHSCTWTSLSHVSRRAKDLRNVNVHALVVFWFTFDVFWS